MGRVSKRGNSLRKTVGVQTEQNVKVRRYRAGSLFSEIPRLSRRIILSDYHDKR